MLVVLYAFPALLAMRAAVVADPDLGWQLRAGQWIWQHRALPVTDPFSAYGAGRPWVAYSWLFEAVLYGLDRLLSLTGIMVYVAGLTTLIAVCLHRLISRVQANFAIGYGLTAAGLLAMAPMYMPRPWLLSILFFILTTDIVLQARRSAGGRRLWLLAPLFAIWANIHVQFLYAFPVLAVATLEPLLNRLFKSKMREGSQALLRADIGVATLGCLAATLLNPYGWKVYRVIAEYAAQPAPFDFVQELQAPSFRSFPDWIFLLVLLTAAWVIGRRRKLEPFPLLLLLAGALLSFRARRDIWFSMVIALPIVAGWYDQSGAWSARFVPGRRRLVAVFVAVCAVLAVAGRLRGLTESKLQESLAATYPVRAVEIVKQRGYSGPLFNDFDWGGYLIWQLPQLKVSMDGRTNLHGEQRIKRHFATWMGGPDWQSDPELSAANLVIANARLPLTALLRTDSRFKLAYQDRVSAVFVRKK